MTDSLSSRIPTPTAQRVFHAPEIWLILQVLGAAPPETIAPADANFDADAYAAAMDTLLLNRTLQTDAQGNIALAQEVDSLVRPAAFPRTVLMANIADRGAQDAPARLICFSRTAVGIVVNWVDEHGDHHFVSYATRDAGMGVLVQLALACDLNLNTPDAALPPPTPADVTRAAEQMQQAVTLIVAANGVDAVQPAQAVQAAGWFISGNSAWLVASSPGGAAQAPRRASMLEIAQTVVGLANRLFTN